MQTTDVPKHYGNFESLSLSIIPLPQFANGFWQNFVLSSRTWPINACNVLKWSFDKNISLNIENHESALSLGLLHCNLEK